MPDRDDPFSEIEQIFDQLTEFGSTFAMDVPVDVVETDDELLVFADLPGRDPGAIDVALTSNRRLRIETDQQDDDHEGSYITRERSRKAASRTVSLPSAVDDAETEATYEDGVLTVRLAKPSSQEGTDIPVR